MFLNLKICLLGSVHIYTGYTGYSGFTGYTGFTGFTGYTGYSGFTDLVLLYESVRMKQLLPLSLVECTILKKNQ